MGELMKNLYTMHYVFYNLAAQTSVLITLVTAFTLHAVVTIGLNEPENVRRERVVKEFQCQV
jgi:hypothetical protein